MSLTIDTARIRKSTPAQLRDYFRPLCNNGNIENITDALLEAIERGSIPPFTFAPWLGVSKSSSVIKRALQQDISVIVRRDAIKQLRKALCSPGWTEAWDALGGTQGLLDIFKDLSVYGVRQACRALGRCGKGAELEEKRIHITELFEGLHPHLFHKARYKTEDQRPLWKFYQHLVPSCSEHIVRAFLGGEFKGKWKPVKDQYLLRYHPDTTKEDQFQALMGKEKSDIDLVNIEGLIHQWPSAPGTIQGFTASMENSLELLQKVSGADAMELGDGFFINQLARPLLRRALKKKAEWSKVHEIVDLIMKYLEKNPRAGGEITTTEGDILHLLARCWAQRGELFEQPLRKMCSHPEFAMTDAQDQFVEWEDFLVRIPRGCSYDLLQLLFYESTNLDIEQDADLKNCKGYLSDTLLNNLSAGDALQLFTRLRMLRDDTMLVRTWAGKSIFDSPAEFGKLCSDPELYHVALQSRNGNVEEARNIAHRMILERKEKATSASLPEHRAFHAKSVVYYAVAADSLDMYEEALMWSKRFLRDSSVYRELHPTYYESEIVQLLSGIPASRHQVIERIGIRKRVERGNAILAALVDIACAALPEPSFKASDWKGKWILFRSVVTKRMEESPSLKTRLQASDEEIYSLLWADTIELLIAVETKLNNRAHEQLGANTLCGPIDCTYQTPVLLRCDEASTYMFLDNLAKERDELWLELRRSRNPAMLSLPEALPRGLPIQYLTVPWQLESSSLERSAPYVGSRVKAIIFRDPENALQSVPDDVHLEKTIGVFVDSYRHALQLYVPESLDKKEQKARVRSAWHHAIGPLSRERMSRDEAVRFWQKVYTGRFEALLPERNTPATSEIWPLLPEVHDATKPSLWNPLSAGRPMLPSRELREITYLDLSLVITEAAPDFPTIHSTFDIDSKPEVPAHEAYVDALWSTGRDKSEGALLSALKYLQTLYVTNLDHNLFLRPFPTADDSRFPVVQLDDGFIQHDDLDPLVAVNYIHENLDVFPPTLLEQFTGSLWSQHAAAQSNEAGSKDPTAMKVALLSIIQLCESDRPQLASELAIRTVMERPEESSWHRQLLKPRFFRNLPASDARTAIDDFLTDIYNMLSETPNNRKPVKVTTLKLVAELMRGNEAVGVDVGLSALIKLMQKASHIDVRLGVLKALLSMLETSTPAVSEKIIDELASLVDMFGHLNERQPLRESDWKLAEETISPPGLEEDSIDSPSALSMLIGFFRKGSLETSRLQKYVNRVILPIVQRLKEQTARWTTLFLRKYYIDADGSSPPIPRDPLYAALLLAPINGRVVQLPRTVLSEHVSYMVFNVAPPSRIKAFNKLLRDDLALKFHGDVAAWLRLYDRGVGAVQRFAPFDMLSQIGTDAGLSWDVSITSEFIHMQCLEVLTALVQVELPPYKTLCNNVLSLMLKGDYLVKPWWQTHGKSILTAMISYVEGIRTQEWEHNLDRQPAVLPDTFPWRLLLLDQPWPMRRDTIHDSETKCKAFIDELSKVIDDISKSPYHVKLEQIKTYLAIDPISSPGDRYLWKKVGRYEISYQEKDVLGQMVIQNRVRMAIHLGDITHIRSNQSAASKLLRFELVRHMISIATDWRDFVDQTLKDQLNARVQEWKSADHEEIRRTGYELEAKYFPDR